jgi:hypothetical protein
MMAEDSDKNHASKAAFSHLLYVSLRRLSIALPQALPADSGNILAGTEG